MKRLIRFVVKYIYAVFSCLYLLTFGVFSERHRTFLIRLVEHFGFGAGRRSPSPIPVVKISEIVSDEISVRILEPLVADGNVTLLELIVISRLVAHARPQKIFEIGTFDGRTTLNLAANCGEGAVVYTLDLPQEKINATALVTERGERTFIRKERPGVRFAGRPEAKKIVQITGDSGNFDFSPYEGTVDFVFVDGSHSHSYALNDSRVALRLLRPDQGMIVWHDYQSWDGVTRALDELYVKDAAFKDLKRIEGTSLVFMTRKG